MISENLFEDGRRLELFAVAERRALLRFECFAEVEIVFPQNCEVVLLPFFCEIKAELGWGWGGARRVDDLLYLADEVVGPVGRRLRDVAIVSLGRR